MEENNQEQNKKKSFNSKSVIKVILVVAVVLSFAMNGYMFYNMMENQASTSSSSRNAIVKDVDYDVKSNTTDVIEQVNDSVVGVLVYENSSNNNIFGNSDDSDSSSGSGSGVVYEVADSKCYIITNNHVIDGASKVEVVFSNNEHVEASIIGKDEYSDVAILECKPDFDVTAINIGDSSLLDKGETVLAIGSPLGIEYAGTVTEGIVSGTDRTVSVDLNSDNVADWDMSVIQTDAAINPGNSGGALVNMAGELVGITSMKLSNEAVEGMGFAIPINDVMEVASQIRKNGKVSHPYIGISGVSLSEYSSYELNYYNVKVSVNDGIYVTKVTSDGPAKSAGIEVGDVIVKLNNQEITTYKSFLTALYSSQAGDTVKVVVNRDGSEKEFKVTLQENNS